MVQAMEELLEILRDPQLRGAEEELKAALRRVKTARKCQHFSIQTNAAAPVVFVQYLIHSQNTVGGDHDVRVI